MKNNLLSVAALAGMVFAWATLPVAAQTSPNLIYGQVPTPAQWNSYFSAKQDTLGYVPVNKAGDIMVGRLVTAPPSPTTAGLNMTCGTAPASPVNGDQWCTTAGMFVQINGATVGPLISATTNSLIVGTSVITSGTSARVLFDNAGVLGEYSITGTGNVVLSTSPTLVTPALGIPSSATLTNATGLPVSTGLAGTGTGVAAALGVNIGSPGAPVLWNGGGGTPTSLTLTNATGLPLSALTPSLGTGVAAALGVNVHAANAFVVNDGTSGQVTNSMFAATMGQYTFKCNNTGGAAGPTDCDLTAFTSKASPVAADIVLIQDSAASFAFKKTTVSALASAGSVASINGQTGTVALLVPPGGRLTLTSHAPVMTASVTGATTLYYDSYSTNTVPYWNGSIDQIDTIASNEVSTAIQSSGTGVLNATGVFDVWWEGNTNHKPCIATNGSGGGWASDTAGSNTARGTGYSQVDHTTRPYTTNANTVAHCYNGTTDYGSITANKLTYLGSGMTGSAGQFNLIFGGIAAGGTAGVVGIWNANNRITQDFLVGDNASSYTYLPGVADTWQAAHGSATMRVTVVRGLNEDGFNAAYDAFGNAGASASISSGVCLDGTSAFTGTTGFSNSTSIVNLPAKYVGQPGAGLHFASACETTSSTTNAATFYGNGAASQSGLNVRVTY